MTIDGGKAIRPAFSDTASPFAPLLPLLALQQDDIAAGVSRVSTALDSFAVPASVHLRILDGADVQDWDVRSGPAAAVARAPEHADVRLVMQRDTWLRIVRGTLAPFDALFEGKVGVGGDTELAKQLVEHLSDPAVPFVPPCKG